MRKCYILNKDIGSIYLLNNTVKTVIYIIDSFYVKVLFIPVIKASLLQSSASHDPSEITLIL